MDDDNYATKEMQDAYAYIKTKEGSKIIWTTGPAGCGKSTFLRKLYKDFDFPNIVCLAPTGIAAWLINGSTIHSFFKLIPQEYYQEEASTDSYKRQVYPKLRNIEYLIIDEISMVRADLLDKIDFLLRDANESKLPFGGIQVFLFGDVYQLPPVVKGEANKHFGIESEYMTPYFFSSKVIKKNFEMLKIFNFTHIFRQTDREFLDVLHKCRDGSIIKRDLQMINDRCVRNPDGVDNVLCLTTRVSEAKDINLDKYNSIHSKEIEFDAQIIGDEKYYENPNNCPAPKKLRVKVGTQVLFTANDPDKRFVNGTIAEIIAIDEIRNTITVRADIGVFNVKPYEWEKIEFVKENNLLIPKVKSRYKQFPMIYGWAMTIHRAQGKTLDKVFINLDAGTFVPGQGYVALSRVRNLEGLYLKGPVYDVDFFTDEYVIKFMEYCKKHGLIGE